MFTNAFFFRLGRDFELPEPDVLETFLAKARFVHCGPTQPQSCGWVPPRPKSDQLAELQNGQLILKLCTEKKAVPSSAIKDAVAVKVEKYKEETGRERVAPKFIKEFKEEALLDLLPRAFAKRSTTMLWIDYKNKTLMVDAASLSGADHPVSALVDVLMQASSRKQAGGLDIQLIHTATSPAASMAHWLATRQAPWKFTIDRDCELKSEDEQKSVIRYQRHTLDIDEVPHHIAAGKVPAKLAMTWSDRVSFVLGDNGQLRKIKLMDQGKEIEQNPNDDRFDTDVAIWTGELRELLPDLLLALGSEVVQEPRK